MINSCSLCQLKLRLNKTDQDGQDCKNWRKRVKI